MTGPLRVLTALVTAAVVVVVAAGPAAAHTVGGVEATNYRSEITAITPTVPGVTIRLRDLGGRVELTNRTDEDIIVQGYENEPYLRVGPSGVFENRRSPSLFQNRITSGSTELVELPPEADPAAPPEWRRRNGGQTVSWRDHRVRWTEADPPAVRANPSVAQTVVSRWSLGFLRGQSTESIVVTGRIAWIPGPAVWPWLVATVVLFAAVLVAGASRSWPQLLSAALAVMIAVDVVRLFGAATQGGGSLVSGLAKAALGGILEVAAWAGGVWAIGAIQKRRVVGLYAAMAVGVVIGFVSGVGDLLNLAYSQVPTTIPVSIARAAVAVCLGIGFGLVGGCFLAARKLTSPATPVAA